jgi:hypothetical protein
MRLSHPRPHNKTSKIINFMRKRAVFVTVPHRGKRTTIFSPHFPIIDRFQQHFQRIFCSIRCNTPTPKNATALFLVRKTTSVTKACTFIIPVTKESSRGAPQNRGNSHPYHCHHHHHHHHHHLDQQQLHHVFERWTDTSFIYCAVNLPTRCNVRTRRPQSDFLFTLRIGLRHELVRDILQ